MNVGSGDGSTSGAMGTRPSTPVAHLTSARSGVTRSRSWSTEWPTLLLILAGVLFRVLVVSGINGSIDQDGAVAGLLARHVLHGDFSVFFWGQHYGGSADAYLLAPITALFPGNLLAIHASALIESVVIPVLLWRILLRYVPRERAAFAAAMAWSFPAFAVAFSTFPELFYNPVVISGLVVVLAGIRFREHPQAWHNPLIWGVAAGFGWWMSPTIVIFTSASAVWLLWQARSRYLVRGLAMAIGGFVIGALPWLVVNIADRWPSLGQPTRYGSYAEHASTQFGIGLPMVFGLRHTFSAAWVVPVALGVTLTLLLLGLLIWQSIVLLLERSPLPLVLGFGAVVIVWIPFSNVISNGRYIYEITAVMIAILGSAVRPLPARIVVAVVVVVASIAWFTQAGEFSSGVRRTLTFQEPGPNRDLQVLAQRLEAAGINRIYSDYWVGGYTLSYISSERILVVPFQNPRSTQYQAAVDGSATPSYLFPAGNVHLTWVETWLQHHGIGYRTLTAAEFVVVTPDRHVVPTDMVPLPADLALGTPLSQLPSP